MLPPTLSLEDKLADHISNPYLISNTTGNRFICPPLMVLLSHFTGVDVAHAAQAAPQCLNTQHTSLLATICRRCTCTQHQQASAPINMPTTIFQDYGGVLGTSTTVPNWDTNPEDICVAL